MNSDVRTMLTHQRWITASFLGWLCGVFVVIGTSGAFHAVGLDGYQFYLGISMGASVGFFQWRLLSRSAGIGPAWIWSSFFGLGLPFFLFDLLKIYGGFSFGEKNLQYSIALGGVCTALWQTALLRRSGYFASRWLLVGWSGWILAAVTVLAVDYTKFITGERWALFAINLTLILSGGVVYGAVTGSALMNILHRSTAETNDHERKNII
jgi:hypothetical protein